MSPEHVTPAGRDPLAARLPDFPWDLLAPHADVARAHPDGIVDLSVGTPVDPVPAVVQAALAASSDTPGYPLTHGTQALRESVVRWLARRLGVQGADPRNVLPTIGSKELVALLPTLLGLGPDDTVVIPAIAYPTYEVGARVTGSHVIVADDPADWHPTTRLVWLNTPSNPTGAVLDVERLRALVAAARDRGVLLVVDECYVELGWEAEPVSVLHADVVGQDHSGVLAVHSLSKRSNLAGYRLGSVTGDPQVVASLLAARKHLGLMVPAPVQSAAVAALDDDGHVHAQRDRYRARREMLRRAIESAGFRVDHSQAGLYLWATRDDSCWDTVTWFASRGVLVTPGEFYGVAGARHVRIALTATDERIAAAVARLSAA